MKRFLVVFFLSMVLLSVVSLNAGPKYIIQWADTLSGLSANTYLNGVAVNTMGNSYVAGEYQNSSDLDWVISQYDYSGNNNWTNTLNIKGDDYANGIAADSRGNIYIVGSSKAGSSFTDTTFDYITAKYDTAGNLVWMDTLNNGSNDYANAVAVDDSGNVYVTGYFHNDTTSDYLTAKYNSTGALIWLDTLNNSSDDEAYGITVDKHGYVYVTGTSGGGYNYYFTVKYNKLGYIVWTDLNNHGYENGNDDIGYGVAVDPNENVYVTGSSYNGNDYDYYTIKYDSTGNFIFDNRIDNHGTDLAYGIVTDKNGNIYVTGESKFGSSYNYYTVKYDSSWNVVWADTLNTGGNDDAKGIAMDNDGSIYVTGYYYDTTDSKYYGLTVKYAKYVDAGILSIFAPDTVELDSSFVPKMWVKNNSYEDTLSFSVWASLDSANGNVYSDTKNITALIPGDSTLINFTQWTAPSHPVDLTLSFVINLPDMDTSNDTMSKTVYVRDLIPPVIDSAIAYEGTDTVPGIDNDDYVILYFSEPTDTPAINKSNINNVLALSSGHSWLDGFGSIGNCLWNSDGTQLLINLTTNVSIPTVKVGDTITPDSSTITDVNGNPCSSPVILGGTFGVYVDAGILSIVSPDTVDGGSNYTPSISVKNNSYDDTLSFDVESYIDSAGFVIYADTQHVANLASGDSLLVNFAQWTAPNDSAQMLLRFALLTSDMDATNDTLSETLFVKYITGIVGKLLKRNTSFNVSEIGNGKILYRCYMAKAGNYDITLYSLNGTVLKNIRGTGVGYKEGTISNVSSGVYFLKFKSGKYSMSRKIIFIK